ncbi:MAG: GTPase HflX [Anaerolineae bacterium]|jgi:GTP-binding protein HflX|nr:GTPase HflX [Anaerolineae bacterium]
MPPKMTEPTAPPKERALMVGIEFRNSSRLLNLEDSLNELEQLAHTAGLDVIGSITQSLNHPNPDTLIGSGKVEEISALIEEYQADIVLFDEELSPRHLRGLEEKFSDAVQVVDRTALILHIFAQHANTREGILQVELAQYEYRLPRLTRAWTHLARQTGGGGGRTGSMGGVGLRGPGETQLEVDRREIRRRISALKSELEKVRMHRKQYRVNRKRSRIPVVTLVGYTNVGKSTLLNRLAGSQVFVADQLFATLDPTTRKVKLPNGQTVLFSDTVGFIQNLPTQLVAAFRATLEEISEADLLIHVVDITHVNSLEQWRSVNDTLQQIGAGNLPVITALNKIDGLPSTEIAEHIFPNLTDVVLISALNGTGLSHLEALVQSKLAGASSQIKVYLPYEMGHLISLFHDEGDIKTIINGAEGVTIEGIIPVGLLPQFKPYIRAQDKKHKSGRL